MGKQLTAADRGRIETFLLQDFTLSQIAAKLKRNVSVISREVKNRSTPNGYFAEFAQIDYEDKRSNCKWKGKLTKYSTQCYVISKIVIGWSPEQISGRMKLEGRDDYVCHETIYKFLYTDECCIRDKIYQYLRYGRKKRKKYDGRSRQCSKIPNRVSIHKRPKEVETRINFGHWEGDSVMYPHKKAINTVNELKTGLVVFTKLERKTAELTAQAMSNALTQYEVKTITVDNGSEFTHHEKVSEATGAQVYFCDPYSSWQRGANENVNGLLRGYLPKRKNIDELSQDELDEIAVELNSRPRKRLGYLTPAESYQQIINSP